MTPSWTADAARALRAYLRAVVFAEPVQIALLERYGVSLIDLRAIRVLRDLGSVPISRLAEELAIPRSTSTGLVDRLEQRGLARRVPCPTDRRVILLQVTRLGLTALQDQALFRDSPPGRRIAALPREKQRQLAQLLEELTRDETTPTPTASAAARAD